MAQVHTLPVPCPYTLVKLNTGTRVGMKKSKQGISRILWRGNREAKDWRRVKKFETIGAWQTSKVA